jgi:NodT family efflux transporter outer membrane factor (OMF) lipoprotein
MNMHACARARSMARAEMAACAILIAAAVLSGGCSVGPDFVRPEAPAVAQYTHGTPPTGTIASDGQAQRFSPDTRITGDWWRLFNSTQLDGVIREAIANEPGLQAAQAALRESQDNLRAGYGVFYPRLDAGAGATRQLYSPLKVGQAAAGSIFSLFTLSAAVSYAIDVFGGARRALEGLQAQTDLQRQTVAATYLALSGNIINTLIARAGYLAQIDSTERLAGMLREQAQITQTQVAAGTMPYTALLGVRSQLAATEAALPPLRQKLDQTGHLLAMLTGRMPAEWSPPQLELADFTLPETLPLTLPSKLVRQRPDILAAEAVLHAASANIGVATAALFPSFALSANYGTNADTFTTLGASAGTFWSAGATATAPIFDGGTLRFKRKAAIDTYRQAEADYRRTVLAAFAQVADTLRGLEHDAETLYAQSEQLAAAQEALRLIEINYRTGTVNYLAVLNADTQYQQARIGYLQTVAQRLQDSVALFVALGGGWWNADPRVFGEGMPPGSGTADNAVSATAAGGR